MALFVSFTSYKWFNAGVSSGAAVLAASSVRNLATHRLRSPPPSMSGQGWKGSGLGPFGCPELFLVLVTTSSPRSDIFASSNGLTLLGVSWHQQG